MGGQWWMGQCCLLLCVAAAGWLQVGGSPCQDGTHTCEEGSQRCVEGDNSTATFTCHCLRPDQQLDAFDNCTDIPDSQILYVTTKINISGADFLLIHQITSNPSLSEEILRDMYRPLAALSSFKDVKFLEYRVGVEPDLNTAVYALIFTENVTSEIRQAVAMAALLLEEVGYAHAPNNVTVFLYGHFGIFDTEEDSRTDQDDVDWCSSPLLYSCRANSTCRDVNFRYDCPCLDGFVDDGDSCYGSPCHDGTHTCEEGSQRCVEGDNGTASFTCHCLQPDQQLDAFDNCTDIPDSQILYVTTKINISGADFLLIRQITSNPSLSEEILRDMYRPLAALSSFKDVKFLEYRVGVEPDLNTAVYALIFTENVTSEIRQAVAMAALLLEEVGYARAPNNVTVFLYGHFGIFDTEEDSRTDQDDVDWCSSPLLYSCRANSTCRDVNFRYDCPCLDGFVDDGDSCYGSPCHDGTHTCEEGSQRCVEGDNGTASFTCHCLQPDQQLDAFDNCTDIPDSQILYVTTKINISGADFLLIHQITSNPSLSEEILRDMYRPLAALSSFKDVKFLEYRVGVEPDLNTAVYALIFTENVTSEIRQAVAMAALLLEEVGYVRTPNNITVFLFGHFGIFDTEEDSRTDQDDVDWCSFPHLYSCRANSTCRDVNFRYDCPCLDGFVDDGDSCYVCNDEFRYGRDCRFTCECVINNTVSCDHANGTCFCKEHWGGDRCDQDVDECTKNSDVCGDPAFHRCINQLEGYRCACAEGTIVDAATGECRGVIIKAPSPFDTDGTRDLHLVCHVSNAAEVTQYEWSDVCLQAEEARCTIRPQPPWDDGKTITCTAHLFNGQSLSASFVLDLNYPPPSDPQIEGYANGEKLPAGHSLTMLCSVIGGKPLVSSVLFSCPRHPDVSPDVISASSVTSVLTLRLTSEDDGAVCTCSALWKQGSWYSHSSTRVLWVEEGDTGAGEGGLDIKWYAIFGAVGVLFLFLIVLTIVIIYRNRGQRRYHDSTVPSKEQTSAGTSRTGQTTGSGSSQPRQEELSTIDYSEDVGNVDRSLGPPPQQHVWRPFQHWFSLARGRSAEDISTWGQERQRVEVTGGRRSRRRTSEGGENNIYDQIGVGAANDDAGDQSSAQYLHPRGLPPLPHPSPYGNPHPARRHHLYSRFHHQTAASRPPLPDLQDMATTTGAAGPRQAMLFEPTGAGREHAEFWP